MKAQDVVLTLAQLADPKRAKSSQWFFKTDPGQYGEGDEFIGVTVPQQRKVAKQFLTLPLGEIQKLFEDEYHEVRLTSLLILVEQFKRADQQTREDIYTFYLQHSTRVNNWDLVDSSAPGIVGEYLLDKEDRSILTDLARSATLWQRRIAIIATLAFIRAGESGDTFKISEILLGDAHDLIHKAVGWMLREVGKSCGQEVEESFLCQHYQGMPRTMLRYAIEHFSPELRQQYLKGTI